MQNLDDFMVRAQQSIKVFDAWAAKMSIPAKADHICFKCGDSAEFERWRALLEFDSQFVYQSMISSRRIAIIKFKTALPTVLGDIWFLELSDQKPDGSQTSGFDHIEIYPTTGSLEELVSTLQSKGAEINKSVRPHHTTYDTVIDSTFTVRIEPEALIEKIKGEEMK